jgi:hypothetical protein
VRHGCVFAAYLELGFEVIKKGYPMDVFLDSLIGDRKATLSFPNMWSEDFDKLRTDGSVGGVLGRELVQTVVICVDADVGDAVRGIGG